MSTFEDAAALVKTFTKSPSNDEKLTLYGLFKQGTVGDCNTSRPGMFDPTGRAKWDAWNKNKGMDSEEAKTKYIAVVEGLKASYA